MRLNPFFKLWEIGEEYMVVCNSNGDVNLSNVYNLNETAAFLWKRIGDKEFSDFDLVEWLLEEYDVEEEIVRKDIKTMIEEWGRNNFIIKD
jgi:hypothetical protein